MLTDTEHHLSRERQERALAGAAADPRIVAVHTTMADTYSARVHADGRAARTDPVASPGNGCGVQRLGG